MKRLILILLILFTSFIYANPVDDSPRIYEIQIIEPDNWFIEINLYEFNLINNIDSMFITGLSGREKVEYIDSTLNHFRIITQENLSNQLQFSKECDSISIQFYFHGNTYYSPRSLIIGEYPGSYLHNITSGQSIVYDMYFSSYYKCSEPTLGEENTGLSAGKIYGYFYDKNGTPILDRYVKIRRGQFVPPSSDYIDSTGYYVSVLPSQYHYYDLLYVWQPYIGGDNWNFNPVEFDLEPGDSIQVDFYASQTSIRPVIQNTIKFNNYPHPASSYTWFFIDNTDIEASAMRVNVYALNGRKVDSFRPRAYQYRYDCSHLPQGSYIMSLQHGREVLATKKLQILK